MMLARLLAKLQFLQCFVDTISNKVVSLLAAVAVAVAVAVAAVALLWLWLLLLWRWLWV